MSDTITETIPVDEAPQRRLVRVDEGRWLAGVCAGLGRYFDVNPLVYRIAFAALSLAGGTGLLLYLAAWLVLPSETSDDSIAVEALREHRDRPWLLLGIGLLSFGAILALSEAEFWPGTGNVWLAALLAGAAIVWWHVSHRADRPRGDKHDAAQPRAEAPAVPRPPKQPSLLSPVLGALLAATGLLGLLAVLDVYEVDVAVALAAGVAIVGGAVAVGAATGRRVGGLVFLGLVLLAGFAAAATTPVSFSSGIGTRPSDRSRWRTWRGRTSSAPATSRSTSRVSSFRPARPASTSSWASERWSSTVPEDVALEIDARAGVGEVNVLGDRDEGAGAHEFVAISGSTEDAPVLKLDADVAFGYLEVRRG